MRALICYGKQSRSGVSYQVYFVVFGLQLLCCGVVRVLVFVFVGLVNVVCDVRSIPVCVCVCVCVACVFLVLQWLFIRALFSKCLLGVFRILMLVCYFIFQNCNNRLLDSCVQGLKRFGVCPSFVAFYLPRCVLSPPTRVLDHQWENMHTMGCQCIVNVLFHITKLK